MDNKYTFVTYITVPFVASLNEGAHGHGNASLVAASQIAQLRLYFQEWSQKSVELALFQCMDKTVKELIIALKESVDI